MVVRNRHIVYFVFYLTFMLIPVLYIDDSLPVYMTVISAMCSGVQAIIRLSEPYVWVEFQKLCCCCLRQSKKKNVYSEESLDSFIKSACNSEYVSFSLAGVIASIQNENQTFM